MQEERVLWPDLTGLTKAMMYLPVVDIIVANRGSYGIVRRDGRWQRTLNPTSESSTVGSNPTGPTKQSGIVVDSPLRTKPVRFG